MSLFQTFYAMLKGNEQSTSDSAIYHNKIERLAGSAHSKKSWKSLFVVERAPSLGGMPFIIRKSPIQTGVGIYSGSKCIYDIHLSERGPCVKRVFSKILVRPPIGYLNNKPWLNKAEEPWLNEALFYKEIAEHIRGSAIIIPKLYDIRILKKDKIGLYLECLENFRYLSHRDNSESFIRALGSLAGISANKAKDYPWLPPTIGRPGNAYKLVYVRQLLHSLDFPEKEANSLNNILEQFISFRKKLRSEYLELPSVIAHNDAVATNVLIDPLTEKIALIDWMRVSNGRIGDDLGRSLCWVLLAFSGAQTEQEFLDAEHRYKLAYCKAAKEINAEFDDSALDAAYEVGSVISFIRFARYYVNLLQSYPRQKDGKAFERMRAYCRLIAARTSNLVTRLSKG